MQKEYLNECLYSDINPYEVIEKKTKTIWVIRKMKCTETEESKRKRQESFVPGGFMGHFENEVQKWDIEPDPNGMTLTVRQSRKDPELFRTHAGGVKFYLSDKPCKFRDFNF